MCTCQLRHLLWKLQQATAGQLQAAQAGRQRWQLLRKLQAVEAALAGLLPADVKFPQRKPAGKGQG